MATEMIYNVISDYIDNVGGIGAAQTNIPVQTIGLWPVPGDQYRIQVDSELMLVTAVAAGQLTVTRGIEGTTASAHPNGAAVSSAVTAGALNNWLATNGGGGGGGLTPCGGNVGGGSGTTALVAGTWTLLPVSGASDLFGSAAVKVVGGIDVGIEPGTAGTYLVICQCGVNTGVYIGLSVGFGLNGAITNGGYGFSTAGSSGGVYTAVVTVGATDYISAFCLTSSAGAVMLNAATSLTVIRVA